MEFAWSKGQKEIFETIASFASRELNDNLVANDKEGVFNSAGWKKCGEMGIQGLPVPIEYGGVGQDALTTVGALERLGYACRDNGLTFSINAHLWTVAMPLVAFGTEAQKHRFLPSLSNGSLIGGNAMSEPGSGSDAYALRTTATVKGDRYILSGSKTFVTNGPVADVLVVFATVDRSKGPSGVTAFLVETSLPGVTVGRRLEKMGLHTSPMSEVFFDDCEVPADNRLGAEGSGASLFTHSMTWERGCILAGAVGSMQRLLETCIRYARSRKQFGQPIGKFQLVASRIVDMKLRLEASRLILYNTAYQLGLGRTTVLESAIAKLHISEAWIRCCEDALQIHGGYGYMTEYEIERELRDAYGSRLYSGTNEVQRNVIAALLM